MDDAARSARASLIRTGLIYSAFLAVDVAVIVYIVVARVSNAAFITLAIVAIVGLLLLYQVVQHVRDFGASPVETDGVVQRKWRRADLIIAMDSYYLTVDRTVFRVKPEDWIHIEEAMPVAVVHFPHTQSVVSVREARRDPAASL